MINFFRNCISKKSPDYRSGRVIFVQPVIPKYRVDFFNALNEKLTPRMRVFASPKHMGVITAERRKHSWEISLGGYLSWGDKVQWQRGVFSVAVHPNDIVVVSGAPRCLSNVFLLVKAQARGAKIIWWGHYRSSTSTALGLHSRMILMRLCDALVFYTDDEVCRFRSHLGSFTKPVIGLNNGLDNRVIGRYRESYSPRRKRYLFFLGRITKKANLPLLLQAMCLLKDESIVLQVVGDGELELEVREMSTALGLDHIVVFHGGIADEKEISNIANRCLMFVYPGEVGLSLIHGMSYGLPCLVHSTYEKHMPEIAAFENGKHGLTFEMENTHSLASSIVEMINSDRLRQWSCSSVEKTESTFNVCDMTSRFVSLIQRLESEA